MGRYSKITLIPVNCIPRVGSHENIVLFCPWVWSVGGSVVRILYLGYCRYITSKFSCALGSLAQVHSIALRMRTRQPYASPLHRCEHAQLAALRKSTPSQCACVLGGLAQVHSITDSSTHIGAITLRRRKTFSCAVLAPAVSDSRVRSLSLTRARRQRRRPL